MCKRSPSCPPVSSAEYLKTKTDLAKLQFEKDELTQQLKNFIRLNKVLSEKLELVTQDNKLLKEKHTKLLGECEDSNKACRTLLKRKEQNENKIEKLEQQISELNDVNTRLECQMHEFSHRLTNQQYQITELTSENKELNSMLTQTVKDYAACNKKNRELNEKLEEQMRVNRELQAYNDKLKYGSEKRLEDSKHSTYRLVRSYRKLERAFRESKIREEKQVSINLELTRTNNELTKRVATLQSLLDFKNTEPGNNISPSSRCSPRVSSIDPVIYASQTALTPSNKPYFSKEGRFSSKQGEELCDLLQKSRREAHIFNSRLSDINEELEQHIVMPYDGDEIQNKSQLDLDVSSSPRSLRSVNRLNPLSTEQLKLSSNSPPKSLSQRTLSPRSSPKIDRKDNIFLGYLLNERDLLNQKIELAENACVVESPNEGDVNITNDDITYLSKDDIEENSESSFDKRIKSEIAQMEDEKGPGKEEDEKGPEKEKDEEAKIAEEAENESQKGKEDTDIQQSNRDHEEKKSTEAPAQVQTQEKNTSTSEVYEATITSDEEGGSKQKRDDDDSISSLSDDDTDLSEQTNSGIMDIQEQMDNLVQNNKV